MEDTEIKKAEATISRLRGALQGLVGASSRAELEGMELFMRTVKAPDVDTVAILNAIHVLLDLMRKET